MASETKDSDGKAVTFNAEDMDRLSRQLGVYGVETMAKVRVRARMF